MSVLPYLECDLIHTRHAVLGLDFVGSLCYYSPITKRKVRKMFDIQDYLDGSVMVIVMGIVLFVLPLLYFVK